LDKIFQDFGYASRAVLLSGLSTATQTAIAVTDTIIIALGKLQAQITSSGLQNPMTTVGNIIIKGQNGILTRLSVGSMLQVIIASSTIPV
jgi:phage tail sheath protein FI